MANQESCNAPADMLDALFKMQTDLNNYVFTSNGIHDEKGNQLTMLAIATQTTNGHLSVNDLPNQWLARYSKAMADELDELNDDLLWKWWSKDKIDLQNVRVELIDLLHFLVSAMIAAGLSAEAVFDIYKQKHVVNVARQKQGYNRDSKTEEDNRTIK